MTDAPRHEPRFEPLEIRHQDVLPLWAGRRLFVNRNSPACEARGVRRRGEQ